MAISSTLLLFGYTLSEEVSYKVDMGVSPFSDGLNILPRVQSPSQSSGAFRNSGLWPLFLLGGRPARTLMELKSRDDLFLLRIPAKQSLIVRENGITSSVYS